MRVFLYAFAVLVSVCCGAEARVLTALPKGADIDSRLQEWVRRAFPDATLGRRTGDNVLVITRDGRFLSITVLDDTRDITTPDGTEASLTQAPFSCRDIRRMADRTTDRIRMVTFSADCPTFGPVFLGVFYDGVRMQGMMIAAGLGQPRELVERAQAIFDGAGPGFAVSEDSEAVPRPFQWPTIAEALADDYSSKMVDEFLAILRESADRGCRAQPGAVPPSRQRAADLLMRYGQRVLDLRAREAD